MIANKRTADDLKARARAFLKALRESQFDKIWHQQITQEAVNLLAASLWIESEYRKKTIDRFLAPQLPDETQSANMLDGLSLAFSTDVEGIRSGTFLGIANQMEQIGWQQANFSEQGCKIFVNTFSSPATAVLIADAPSTPLLLLFIKDNQTYKLDFEALILFSMFVRASHLYAIGLRATELKNEVAAVSLLEMAASLESAYKRLQKNLVRHSIVQKLIAPERHQEINDEASYCAKARAELEILSSEPEHRNHLIVTKTRRLRLLEQAQARKGIDTPADIQIEIEDLREELEQLRAQQPGEG